MISTDLHCWSIALRCREITLCRHHRSIALQKQYVCVCLSVSDNTKRLWQTVKTKFILDDRSSSPLPHSSPGTSLADSFANFFTDKMSKLRISLTSNSFTSSLRSHSSRTETAHFSSFFLFLLLLKTFFFFQTRIWIWSLTFLSTDLTNSLILKVCAYVLTPTITNIVNLSHTCGTDCQITVLSAKQSYTK